MQHGNEEHTFYKNFAKKFVCLLILLSCTRLMFFFCNHAMFANDSLKDILLALAVGMRFDMAVLSIINAPIIIFWALSPNLRPTNIFSKIFDLLFFAVNFLAILIESIDAKFFSFTSRRMSADILNQKQLLLEDTSVYIRILCDFWYIALCIIIMAIALYFVSTKIKINQGTLGKNKLIAKLFVRLLFSIAVIVVGVRGGIQRKPIAPVDSNIFAPTKSTASLVNNSLFNIIKTRKFSANTPVYKFFDEEKCREIYSPIHHEQSTLPISSNFFKKNVFIIILESFTAENIGALDKEFKEPNWPTYTPFLDEMAKKSLVMDGFANGLISIDGLTSILTSIPPIFGYSYATSQYIENDIDTLPGILKKNGYDTVFFYGGQRNSCHFDGMRCKSGIEKYFSEDDYKGDKSNIYGWGVCDSDFFPLVAEKLSEMTQPFFGALFTLSSHHPFIYPKKFEGMFPKGKIKLQELMAYTDFSLKSFFQEIEKTDWYKNTIFILVADHTAGHLQPYYTNSIGRFSIPIMIFDPENNLPEPKTKLMQQIDIMPSILDLLGIQDSYFSFGTSIFRDEKKHFLVQRINGLYQVITDKYVLRFDGTKTLEFYKRDDFLLKNNLINSPSLKKDRIECENMIKAFLQEYSTALKYNKMTITETSD